MTDLLFIELGAVVTEIKGRTKCTIEPFCDSSKKPTYSATRVEIDLTSSLEKVMDNRVEIDLEFSLENVMYTRGSDSVEIALPRVQYDYYMPKESPSYRSKQIGKNWPSGNYEGIVTFRDEFVNTNTNATLAAAAATLPGRRYEYQRVVSIDDETGDPIRRYHGFHAKLLRKEGDVLVLNVAHAGKSEDPSSPWKEIPYNPADTTKFYTGALVATNILSSDLAPGSSGAVFIEREAAALLGVDEPKLPPGLGGAPEEPKLPPNPGSVNKVTSPEDPVSKTLPPTSEGRAEVYYVLSLADALNVRGSGDPVVIAVQRAVFGQFDRIGSGRPGDSYDGLMYIREDVVKSDAALALAVATLPGRPWEHQAVVAVNEVTGVVQRYHGFHAKIVGKEGNVLVLEIANTGTSADPRSPRKTIRYNPADTTKFYTGSLVAENVRSGQAPGSSGAVFITPEAAKSFGMEVPDLLLGAENAASFSVKLPELTPGSEEVARFDVLLPTLPPIAHAAARLNVPPPSRPQVLSSDHSCSLVKEASHG